MTAEDFRRDVESGRYGPVTGARKIVRAWQFPVEGLIGLSIILGMVLGSMVIKDCGDVELGGCPGCPSPAHGRAFPAQVYAGR